MKFTELFEESIPHLNKRGEYPTPDGKGLVMVFPLTADTDEYLVNIYTTHTGPSYTKYVDFAEAILKTHYKIKDLGEPNTVQIYTRTPDLWRGKADLVGERVYRTSYVVQQPMELEKLHDKF